MSFYEVTDFITKYLNLPIVTHSIYMGKNAIPDIFSCHYVSKLKKL